MIGGIKYPDTSLIVGPDIERVRFNRDARRRAIFKQHKIKRCDTVHKARDGKVYLKHIAEGIDKVIRNDRYDGRFV